MVLSIVEKTHFLHFFKKKKFILAEIDTGLPLYAGSSSRLHLASNAIVGMENRPPFCQQEIEREMGKETNLLGNEVQRRVSI